MKLTALILIICFSATAATTKTRKISNSAFYRCLIERVGEGRPYKQQKLFPFPVGPGEVYELKSSQRWNNIKIVFSSAGVAETTISENIAGKRFTGTIKKTMTVNNAGDFSLKISVPLNSDGARGASYKVTCGPE
jgi:hypothetical protein